MTTGLFSEIANAPEDDESTSDVTALFGEPEFDGEPPKRTVEPTPEEGGKRRGRGSRTRVRECESCGKTYTGGHKLCPDCKGTGVTKSTASTTRGSAKLEEELLEATISVASDISAVMPTVAGVLVARAEVAVSGMMQVSKGHPRVQKILSRAAGASKIADLMQVVLMLVIAGMVDIGRIDVESPLLDRIGFSDIERDEKGKAKRDDKGMLVKQRATLRDIHDSMTGEQTAPTGTPPGPMWQPGASIHPDTGTGMPFVPPMNWTP